MGEISRTVPVARDVGSACSATSTVLSLGGRRQQRLGHVEDGVARPVLRQHEHGLARLHHLAGLDVARHDDAVHPGLRSA